MGKGNYQGNTIQEKRYQLPYCDSFYTLSRVVATSVASQGVWGLLSSGRFNFEPLADSVNVLRLYCRYIIHSSEIPTS